MDLKKSVNVNLIMTRVGSRKCAPVAYLKLVNGGWGVVNSDWIVVIVEGPKPAGVGASPITIFRPAVKFMDGSSFTVVGIDCSILFHYYMWLI